jgi:hypothetical protein
MKWNLRADFATWGTAGMGPSPVSVLWIVETAPTGVPR